MNEMRKLMEAIEQIEEDAYEVNVDIVAKLREQLASAIADDIMTKINLTSENAQDAFNTISNYTEGYVSAVAKDLKQSAELALNDRLEVAVDSMDSVEEGKWDYQKKDKGKGAGTDSPMHDGGAKNRKSRKAFRKAEKAKAHQARMRGEIDEGRDPREATIALIELMDEGVLDPRAVADAALSYMSESEVEDMADSNYFFGESVEEGKWDYPQGMKGKGAAYKEIKGSGNRGNANRKSRKAFRKAEKAKAHQTRMRGQIE